jgi:cysteine sulfinate desulfinase/cysteine desulfurase-like protein
VIEKAREQVAELLGANPREILFTSCATESNNAAIHAALNTNSKKRHVITSAVEHSSVLTYCRTLETEGVRVTYLPVDRDGFKYFSACGSKAPHASCGGSLEPPFFRKRRSVHEVLT